MMLRQMRSPFKSLVVPFLGLVVCVDCIGESIHQCLRQLHPILEDQVHDCDSSALGTAGTQDVHWIQGDGVLIINIPKEVDSVHTIRSSDDSPHEVCLAIHLCSCFFGFLSLLFRCILQPQCVTNSFSQRVLHVSVRESTFQDVSDELLEYQRPIVGTSESVRTKIVLVLRVTDSPVQLSHLIISGFFRIAILIFTKIRDLGVQVKSISVDRLKMLPCGLNAVLTEIQTIMSMNPQQIVTHL